MTSTSSTRNKSTSSLASSASRRPKAQLERLTDGEMPWDKWGNPPTLSDVSAVEARMARESAEAGHMSERDRVADV